MNPNYVRVQVDNSTILLRHKSYFLTDSDLVRGLCSDGKEPLAHNLWLGAKSVETYICIGFDLVR